MRKIKINNSGELLSSEKSFFGGEYSLWEKLKKKGVGSAKIIYDQGITEFDKLGRNIEGEISFVSFEILKNGLILRLNRNQRIECVGVQLNQLAAINLVGYRIDIVFRDGSIKRVHRGELEIKAISGATSSFSVITREFKTLVSFFQKEELSDKFNYSISTDPPELDGYKSNADYKYHWALEIIKEFI